MHTVNGLCTSDIVHFTVLYVYLSSPATPPPLPFQAPTNFPTLHHSFMNSSNSLYSSTFIVTLLPPRKRVQPRQTRGIIKPKEKNAKKFKDAVGEMVLGA